MYSTPGFLTEEIAKPAITDFGELSPPIASIAIVLLTIIKILYYFNLQLKLKLLFHHNIHKQGIYYVDASFLHN
jgi:hypothetical protein